MSRFLPPILRSQSICIDSHDLHLCTEPNGRELYTYTVKWHDLKPIQLSHSVDYPGLRGVSPQFSLFNVSQKHDLTSAEKQFCERFAPSNALSAYIRECYCDGPCGKLKPVSEIRVMGLCDHYICSACLEKTPAVRTANGFCCPNVNCSQADSARSLADPHRRRCQSKELVSSFAWTPSHGATTNDKTQEDKVASTLKIKPWLCLVEVRLTSFHPIRNSDKVCRRQHIVEIYGDYTILQTINILKEYEKLNSLDVAHKVFYCLNGLIDERSSWKHIREEDLLMPITNFGQENRRIDIIFDCTTR